MSVDIERSAMSLDKQSEVMRLDITDVTCPLPEQVKLRWGPYKQRQMSKPEGSLEQIQARMAAADKNRQVRTPACRNCRDRKLASGSSARVVLPSTFQAGGVLCVWRFSLSTLILGFAGGTALGYDKSPDSQCRRS